MKNITIFAFLFVLSYISSFSQTQKPINPNPCTTYGYIDNDMDGFGAGALVCVDTFADSGQSWSVITGDCNDNNASINPNTIWYIDADGDGFGSASNTKTQCTQPSGYVLNATDCNDTNNLINPNTKWYADTDLDGYGSGAVIATQCLQPSSCSTCVSNNIDCSPTNPNENISKTWYIDADGDGFGEITTTQFSCTQPTGFVSNSLDNCPGITGSIQGCILPPATGFSTGLNYIITKKPKIAVTTTSSITNSKDISIGITYFDGIGRPMQQIVSKLSASGNDIIIPIKYDAFGRQTKNYLPFKSSTASLTYDSNDIADETNFYNSSSIIQNGTVENTSNPYSEKLLEASPLDRLLKQSSEGNDWVMGNNHEVKINYQLNNSTDAVKYYAVTSIWNASLGYYTTTFTQNGSTNYADNELEKNVVKNENWIASDGTKNTTEQYKDKEGHTVLSRTYNFNSTSGTTETLDTYNVYDQFGNLTYIIPPLVTNLATTPAQIDGLCYQYHYDYRNRLVEKKIPSKQWEFIVYDKLNRIVATGPTLSPFTDLQTTPPATPIIGWIIAKYDVYNRAAYTGWQQSTTVTSAGRKTLQDAQNNLTTTLSESKTTSGTIDGVSVYYSNLVAPTAFKLLAVNYYDNYNFPSAPTVPTTVDSQTVYYNNTIKPIGMPTGSWVRVPETSTTTPVKAEISTVFYDKKSHILETNTTNYLGGYTIIDYNINAFSGKVNYTLTTHKRLSSDTQLLVKDAFTYTNQDRLLTHTHQINGGTIQLLSKNEYDELGKLIVKRVGGTDITGVAALQKVDYSYNIRGWLTGINDVTNLKTTTENDLFAFKINYNTVQNATNYTGTPLYNGNIAETYWRTKNDNTLRKYGYKYDNLNRLTNAIYQLPNAATPVTNSYDESLDYDKNGNIQHLQRNGNYEDQVYHLQIDNLTYTYDTANNNLNRLLKVDDNPSTATSGFKDGNTVGNDYDYDNFGNLILDKNKTITSIVYNHLNLPTKITFSGTNKNIVYVYDATGKKVSKIVTNGSSVNTTDYLDGFQYLKTGSTGVVKLQFFPTTEGYVSNTVVSGVNTYNYVYNYTDHLGNVRLSYGYGISNGVAGVYILSENNYYPFGLQHSGYNTSQMDYTNLISGDIPGTIKPVPLLNYALNNYKFQGQELQSELSLNWDSFKWRNYDPAIGRFMSVDPLAEKYAYNGIYNFSENRVIDGRELEGLEWVDFDFGLFEETGITQNIATEEGMNGGSLPDVEILNGAKASGIADTEIETDTSFWEDIANGIKDAWDWVSGADEAKPAENVGESAKENKPNIPEGWDSKASKKGGGEIHQDPKNPHNSIREMPGKSESSNKGQQVDYIKYMKDGTFYDKNGNPLENGNDEASHIPKSEFDQSKMPPFN